MYVYKLCIGCNYFQAASKQAKAIPPFKSEKTSSDLSNYKTISVLKVLSKSFEKHINKLILAHFKKHNLLHPNFRTDITVMVDWA